MNEVMTVSVSHEQLDLVRATVAKDSTPAELSLFLYDCQRQNVHPLDKLIHFTKRSGRYVPITSIDFLRMRAGSTGSYAGANDGTFTGEPAKPGFSCQLTVYRIVQGMRCEWQATARWEEYYPGEGIVGQMWRKMPHVMLSKVAEALALRKAFADVLHGLYTKEEMDQAGEGKAPKEAVSLKEKLAARIERDTEPVALPTPIVEAEPVEVPAYTESQYPLEVGPARTGESGDGTFPVGKHKGEAMETIPTTYLRWASENMTNQAAKGMAAQELARRAGESE